jgi:hypothetical protein
MSEMVEKVAKAMHRVDALIQPSWESLEGEQEDYREYARAAIAAMREPTEAMIRAMCGSDVLAENAKRDWQSAIDEALK